MQYAQYLRPSRSLLVSLLILGGVAAQETELVRIPPPDDPAVISGVFGGMTLAGDQLLIADPSAYNAASGIAGSVYVYQRDGARWEWVQTLRGRPTSSFGSTVRVDGDTAAISSPSLRRSGRPMGAVDVFRLRDGEWQPEQQLFPDDFGCDAPVFGASVALSGSVLAVTLWDCPLSPHGRQLRIYERDTRDRWEHVKTFRTTPTVRVGRVEGGLAAEGDLIVTGLGGFTGSALVLRRGPEGWYRSAWLSDPLASLGDEVGHGVAIDGETIVVGAPTHFGVGGASHAVVFERRGLDQWDHVQDLWPSDPFSGVDFRDEFGYSVAIDGDEIAVGARHAATAGFNTGAVYYFKKGPNGWPGTETERYVSSVPIRADGLGAKVDIQGGLIVSSGLDLGGHGVRASLVFGVERGSAFCATLANSTGQPTQLSVHGSDAPGSGSTYFRVRELPGDAIGGLAASLFRRPERAVFNGNLCLGPAVRLLGRPSQAGPTGELLEELNPSSLGVGWMAGSTFYFQYWHTDAVGQGVYFSNGVEVVLQQDR